jgi:hypothetical protein
MDSEEIQIEQIWILGRKLRTDMKSRPERYIYAVLVPYSQEDGVLAAPNIYLVDTNDTGRTNNNMLHCPQC